LLIKSKAHEEYNHLVSDITVSVDLPADAPEGWIANIPVAQRTY
jgi:hypothetical protein